MIPIIDNAYYKLGGTVIGILTSYVLYENVYNKDLYHNDIHKNIGKIIAEYQIDYRNEKLYNPIEPFSGKSWIFDTTNTEIVEGINKLQTKNPNMQINVREMGSYPYHSYVVIRNKSNKIYISLDDPSSYDDASFVSLLNILTPKPKY